MSVLIKVAIFFLATVPFITYGYLINDRNYWPAKSIKQFARTWTTENLREELEEVPIHHLAEYQPHLKHNGLLLDALGDGYLAVTSMYDRQNTVALVDRTGAVVKKWVFDFKWAVKKEKLTLRNDLHGAIVLPDGSALANFEHRSLVKLDKCGKLQWLYPKAHHSLDLTPRNTLWVPTRTWVKDGYKSLRKRFIRDEINELDLETGKELRRISVPDLFFKNNLEGVLFSNGLYNGENKKPDITHLNDVEELRPEMAAAFPLFSAGDLLISLRNINMVMVFDPNTLRVKWYQTHPWIRQHDPDFQPDGTITIYNNNTSFFKKKVHGGSSIVKIHPVSRKVTTLYQDNTFYSQVRGKHTILDDGRMLITEFNTGRVFGVTPKGKLFLEYAHKFDQQTFYEISQAEIIPPGYFTTDLQCAQPNP